MPPGKDPHLVDAAPARETFRDEVLKGLRERPKRLPCKYLYDERGSRLFERICGVEEYYPTRTEIGILRRTIGEIARILGPRCLVLEPGSGSGAKTRMLLDRLNDPVAYVPVEISREALLNSANELAAAYPRLEVLPVCADFLRLPAIPAPRRPPARTVAYFPGSTIGNLHPDQAAQFLKRLARLCGPNGAVLVGVDLRKDPEVLERAYDDAGGITAAFNLNILRRINRELDGDFDPARFRHRAIYNSCMGRIEMHLVSLKDQEVHAAGGTVAFRKGESIRTECSYKYTLEGFQGMAGTAGLKGVQVWTDRRQWFSVQLLAPAGSR